MSLWLTDEELIELTGYRQRDKQRIALAEMVVKFRVRPADGFPLVDRAQFTAEAYAKGKRKEPNWSAA